jgi:hypothetical protein
MPGKQESRHINCPHCGEIIEVICPDVDRGVKKILANKVEFFNFYNFDSRNTSCCKICKKSIVLYWSFNN